MNKDNQKAAEEFMSKHAVTTESMWAIRAFARWLDENKDDNIFWVRNDQ